MKKNLSFICIFTALSVLFSLIGGAISKPTVTAYIKSTPNYDNVTIVIDPGHGGEDGGASSYGSVPEKDLNLSIGLILYDMLVFFGIDTVMTRSEDVLLYDKNSDHKGHKKTQDLAKRLNIAQSIPNAILISIHMNAFPESKYKGAQVYYSPNADSSRILADALQENIKTIIDTKNQRNIKQADKSIYLLRYFEGTGVLIECGFLSNPNEYETLCDPNYRKALSAVFCGTILQYLKTGGR